ncbi:RutC family protein YjgH [Xylophilus ampelinus]|nr:RidA family protein [Variovorax sp.]VTY34457.1 RutC family protein YjgH [Xylophilus ampelinus]
MQNIAVNPPEALAPIGMFSNGILSKPGRVLAIAGQAGVAGPAVPTGFEEQTRNCWKAIEAIVRAAGGSMADLVSINIYLKDGSPENYRIMNEVRKDFLVAPYPASTAIGGVQFMLPAMEIEIQAFAVIPDA